MRVAASQGASSARRSATAVSGRWCPAAEIWPMALVSPPDIAVSCHTCSRPGSSCRTAVSVRASSTLSTAHARAPESCRIQRTWSGEAVG